MYYAVVNDLIGGYDVSTYNKTVGDHGEDEWTFGSFMSQEDAVQVAHALNAVDSIIRAWNNPTPIPALGLFAPTITRRDILKRNWPELAAAIKAAAIRERTDDT